LELDVAAPLKTVYGHLAARGATGLLSDRLITVATREIIADGVKDRATLNRESREKHRAIDILADKYSSRQLDAPLTNVFSRPPLTNVFSLRYSSRQLDAEEIKLCLYSIGDNHSYLTSNRDPVEKMIKYLTKRG
jgi:hypothetical protein